MVFHHEFLYVVFHPLKAGCMLLFDGCNIVHDAQGGVGRNNIHPRSMSVLQQMMVEFKNFLIDFQVNGISHDDGQHVFADGLDGEGSRSFHRRHSTVKDRDYSRSLSSIRFNSFTSALDNFSMAPFQEGMSASIFFRSCNPLSVMEISTCLRLFSQISRFTRFFWRSFSTSRVQLLLLSIMRCVISASIMVCGWLPRKILNTLNCSGVIPNFFKFDALIL